MSKQITRGFAPSNRYQYDGGMCSASNGWCQIDTLQDASYYGTWINPTERKIFSYCEGDTCLVELDTDEELRREMLDIYEFNRRYSPEDIRRFGIDPLGSEKLKQACVDAGLEGYLH